MANTAILQRVLTLMVCPARLSVEQVLVALERVSRAIPESDLHYRITPADYFERIDDRVAHVRDGLRVEEPFTASLPGLHNANHARLFSFSADYLVNFAVEDYWNVCFERPPDALEPRETSAFLLGLGDALGAYYGTEGTYLGETANDQLNHQGAPGFSPPHGLPELFSPREYVSMVIPLCFDWGNYWSKQTVDTLEFCEHEHASLFYRSHRGADGSLAFQLTAEPLELERCEDIQALKAAYAAFPGVGGRDPRFRIADERTEEGAL